MHVLIVKWNFKLANPNDLSLYSKSHLLGTKKKTHASSHKKKNTHFQQRAK